MVGVQDIIMVKHVVVVGGPQGYCGLQMTTTEHPGFSGVAEGVAGGPHAFINRSDDKHARGNKKK